jgi:hypothetical protein
MYYALCLIHRKFVVDGKTVGVPDGDLVGMIPVFANYETALQYAGGDPDLIFILDPLRADPE